MAGDRISFIIAAAPPPRLDKALSRDVPEAAALSRTRLARLIDQGAVTVDGQPATDAKARVSEGARIEIVIAEAAQSDISAEPIPLEIVHEDDDLIVVDKPAGMVVHPAPGAPSGTLVNALLHHCGDRLSGVGGVKRPGVVHRIDKDTSGLLVVAKSDAAHYGLAAQFKAHDILRSYRALCWGVPDAGDPRLRGIAGVRVLPGGIEIDAPIARHRADRKRMAVAEGGRWARTSVTVEQGLGTGRAPALALLRCRLSTGRTHQIRVHMAYIGHGLVGDPVYGGRRKLRAGAVPAAAAQAVADFPRQALHAAELGFVHPVSGAELAFRSDLPADFAALLALLES